MERRSRGVVVELQRISWWRFDDRCISWPRWRRSAWFTELRPLRLRVPAIALASQSAQTKLLAELNLSGRGYRSTVLDDGGDDVCLLFFLKSYTDFDLCALGWLKLDSGGTWTHNLWITSLLLSRSLMHHRASRVFQPSRSDVFLCCLQCLKFSSRLSSVPHLQVKTEFAHHGSLRQKLSELFFQIGANTKRFLLRLLEVTSLLYCRSSAH